MMSIRNQAQYHYKIMHMMILMCIISRGEKNFETKSSFYVSTNAHFGAMFVYGAETGDTENGRKRVGILGEQSSVGEEKIGRLRKRESYIAKKSMVIVTDQTQMTIWQIMTKAGKRGLGGGIPGAAAGLVQVICLMWLRTILNYQYRYGTTFQKSLKTLYNEGGIQRLYRGLSFAVVQAPLSRFVSTAANDGVQAFLANFKLTEAWGPSPSTLVASFVVGMWRMILMPIDTCKTVLQVDSVEGFRKLMTKVKAGKFHLLYEGAFASAIYAIMSHYPWFYTYNFLSKNSIIQSTLQNDLLRNAVIGFISSAISDTCTNVIRVIKVTKQAYASKHCVSYSKVVAIIFAADGWKGLFSRGLRTRILGNAFQSVLFTVVWRGLAERWGSQV